MWTVQDREGIMGDGDKTAPIITEFLGKDASALVPLGPDNSVCPPLHRMHERRVVRSAGHMIIGVTMPAPEGIEAEAARLGNGTPVFYSHEDRNRARGGTRAALAVACVVAIGGAVVLGDKYSSIDKSAPAGAGSAGREMSADATSARPASGRSMQLLALSEEPAGQTRDAGDENIRTAALSPAVVADQPSAPSSGFTRVAQKDLQGLVASNVFGPAGAPIRLPISLNGARPEDYSFLMFRGLPPEVTLSAGFRLKESWAVSLRDMDNLSIETPPQFQGSFKLEILLIKGRDTPAESRVITVEVVPADIQIPPSAAVRQPAPGPQVLTAAPRTIEPVERAVPAERPAPPVARLAPAPAPAPSSTSTMSPQQEEMMMKRAAGLLASKDVMSARLLLEHMATNGSGRAALAMGKTFDPGYLQSMGISTLKPDVGKARQWYRRAAELGDPEATSSLSGLASR
jgi:hypothetical protein